MKMRQFALTLFLSFGLLLLSASAGAQQVQIKGPKNGNTELSGSTYGPVSPSDTLWRIASRYRQNKNLSVYQVMQAIYQLNPNGFEDNNFNHLIDGSILNLPSERYIARIDPEQARVKAENDDSYWSNISASGQIGAAAKVKSSGVASKQDLSETKQVIEDKLTELDAEQNRQFMAIRQQFSESIASVQSVLGENRKLLERLDDVDQDISELKGRVNVEIQTQMDQMLELQNQLLAISRDAELTRRTDSEKSNFDWLTDPITLIALTVLLSLSLLVAFWLWLMNKKRASQSDEMVLSDDQSLAVALEQSDEMDELADALSNELSDELVDSDEDDLFAEEELLDDVLSEELKESLDENIDDDFESFDDLGDESLELVIEDSNEQDDGLLEQEDLDSLFDEDDELLAQIDTDQESDDELNESLESTPQQPEPEAVTENEPEAVVENEPEAVVENEPEAVVESELEALSENEPEAVVENEPEAVVESEPEAVVETEPEAVTENEPEAVVESEPEAVVESEPEAVTESEPEAVTESEPEAVTESEPDAVVESEPEAVVEGEPEAVVENEPEAVVESEPEAVVESELEALTESEPDNANDVVDEVTPIVEDEQDKPEISIDELLEQPEIELLDEIEQIEDMGGLLDEIDDELAFDEATIDTNKQHAIQELDSVADEINDQINDELLADSGLLDETERQDNQSTADLLASLDEEIPSLGDIDNEFDDLELEQALSKFDEDIIESDFLDEPQNVVGKESAVDLDDLPGLGDWLTEDELSENKDIDELETSSFDQILDSIEEDVEPDDQQALPIDANTLDDSGLDFDSLLTDIDTTETLEAEKDESNFVDVEDLINESDEADEGQVEKKLNLDAAFGSFDGLPSESKMVDVDDDKGIGAKLDLAQAYIETDEIDAAKLLLEEILDKGDEIQQLEAKELLDKLS